MATTAMNLALDEKGVYSASIITPKLTSLVGRGFTAQEAWDAALSLSDSVGRLIENQEAAINSKLERVG